MIKADKNGVRDLENRRLVVIGEGLDRQWKKLFYLAHKKRIQNLCANFNLKYLLYIY
jgi:hypothetical protein